MSTTLRTLSRTIRLTERLSPALAGRAAYALWLSTAGRKRVHPREQGVIDDAHVEPFTLANGRRGVAYQWGAGERPVLLVHGWRGRAATFAPIVSALREQGRAVLAFDAPAHGDAPGRRTDIRDWIAAIRLLQERHGAFEAIAAHSFGALASAVAAREGVTADRLVLLAGVAESDYLVTSFAQRLALSSAIADRVRTRFARRVFADEPELWERFSVLARPLGGGIPMLVVHDEGDREVAIEQSRRLVDAHAGSTLVTTSGLGHNGILRDPDVVRTVTGFVTEGAAASRNARAR